MSWDLILHEWRSLETHKIFHLFGKRQDLEEFRKKTSWLQELIIWLQGFSKQARQNWSPEDWWGLFVGKKGFWRISIVTFKKTQRWMKHDSAVVTGSSRETGHFCDLGWGSSGFGHRVHSFFLAAFVFFVFSWKFNFSVGFLWRIYEVLYVYCHRTWFRLIFYSELLVFQISLDIQFNLMQYVWWFWTRSQLEK